jgi:hypothetical protein
MVRVRGRKADMDKGQKDRRSDGSGVLRLIDIRSVMG